MNEPIISLCAAADLRRDIHLRVMAAGQKAIDEERAAVAAEFAALVGTPVELKDPATWPAWLPIETAPKDGTAILAAWGHGMTLSTMWWDGGQWCDALSGRADPAFWMPIPPHPVMP